MNFKFANLLGAPYRGGSILLRGNQLFSPVGNRISQVDLAQSTSSTLPFENLRQIQTLCISPDASLLLSVDEEGRALLINLKRRVLLHHFSFKGPVACAKFSPDGQFFAAAVGKVLQVWATPALSKQMTPMHMHRSYAGVHGDITALDWSEDSQFIAIASKDLTARVFSLNPIEGYVPPTLAGHKDALVGVFFTSCATQQAAELAGQPPPALYTASRDGALFAWQFQAGVAARPSKRQRTSRREAAAKQVAEGAEEGAGEEAGKEVEDGQTDGETPARPQFAGGSWQLSGRHYFLQNSAKLTAVDLHRGTGVLVAAFSHGVFELYQLPDFTVIHTLSISRERISAACFNTNGDWIALGCARLGQLLVWEWRSETYVLKQQGHYFDIATAAFSPDAVYIATGADDNKVKVFQMSSGFCFVTFSEHTAPVSAVQWAPSGHVLLSASLDGTVRAYDLLRYRNFRTMTAPDPVQFSSLAIDPAGEIVCAGTLDTFQIYVWSLKTGRLLDVLAAHEGPVCGLAFCPTQPLLASCSWDRTVRTWDVFGGKGALESLTHSHDVLTIAFRPDGKQLAAATLDGAIQFWDPLEGSMQGTIEGRRDIRGGRLMADRRAAGNLSSGAAFSSLSYSADGAFLLAGGSSKFICMYDVAERVMLRRFQISHNRSLDGVLDVLNSKNMTDAGPVDLLDVDDDDDDTDLQLPGGGAAAASNLPGTKKKRPMVRCRGVCLAATGRSWAAATTEGLLLYSLDDALLFDPTDLTEDLTPAACHAALAGRAYVRALLIALRLGDPELMRHTVFSTPIGQVDTVAGAIPPATVPAVLTALADCMADSPHLEFLLAWLRAACVRHGSVLQSGSAAVMPALRSLQKALGRQHGDLAGICEGNLYTLAYLTARPLPSTATQDANADEGQGKDAPSARGTADDDEEDPAQERQGGGAAELAGWGDWADGAASDGGAEGEGSGGSEGGEVGEEGGVGVGGSGEEGEEEEGEEGEEGLEEGTEGSEGTDEDELD